MVALVRSVVRQKDAFCSKSSYRTNSQRQVIARTWISVYVTRRPYAEKCQSRHVGLLER
jgi:hypothetical protein